MARYIISKTEIYTTGWDVTVVSATFDDPNLVSSAGLVPVMRIADSGTANLSRRNHFAPFV